MALISISSFVNKYDNYKYQMLGNRIGRLLFCTAGANKGKKQVIPKAPRLLSGELEPFRMTFENAQLYEGYTLDELYGAKIGPKHPPAVKAQMTKDSIAATLIFVVGFGLTIHLHNMFKKQLESIDKVQASKQTEIVAQPPAKFKNPAFYISKE